MPYTKTVWTDEELAGPERYNILEDDDIFISETVQIVLDTAVTTPGTGVTAARMNNIEAGISDIAKGTISGLKLQRVSATALTVGTGYAGLSDGSMIVVSTAIAKTSLSLSANTWYHVYLYDNGGTPDIEIVTTAPATAYFGTARAKTGDTSRRYIGSARAGASANILYFTMIGSGGQVDIVYGEDFFTVLRVLSGGSATTETDVSLAGLVPPTVTNAKISAFNNSAGTQFLYLGASGADNVNPGAATGVLGAAVNRNINTLINTDASQNISYALSAASGSVSMQVQGYVLER